MNTEKIEVVFVDDNVIFGGMLSIRFMENKKIEFKFFSSQEDYKNSYEQTCDTNYLISDQYMPGEPNGVEFVKKEQHRFNEVIVTSGLATVLDQCYAKNIPFIDKANLYQHLEDIEIGKISIQETVKETATKT